MGRMRRWAQAGALIALLPGLAAAGVTRAAADPNPGIRNFLTGVKALSPTDVWAVGFYCASACNGSSQVDQTLIEHWDGTAWTQVPSPDPSATLDQLNAVTATSPTDVWAVGYYCASDCLHGKEVERTLVLHWDGTSWSQVSSPNPAPDELTAVTATSAANVWAVGFYCTAGCLAAGGTLGTLTEHWNGTAWSRVRSPNPGAKPTGDGLAGVAASGAGSVWAAGSYCTSNCFGASQTFANLILHWTGTAWSKAPAPTPKNAAQTFLEAASADAPSDAWAGGWYLSKSGAFTSMMLHWNGSAWSLSHVPSPGNDAQLNGLSAESPTGAWAVGQSRNPTTFQPQPLFLRWNGTAWSRVNSPKPDLLGNGDRLGNGLFAVSADSPSDAWAVGDYCTAECGNNTETDGTLILHWNGTRWSLG